MVRWVVRRQWLGNLSFADALAEGRIGLWRALAGYDPSRGTAFSSYAVPAITHAVWSAVDRSRALAQPQSPAQFWAEPADPDESLHMAELQAGLSALVAQLPPRLELVIVAHYGLADAEPQSFAAIGRTLQVSRQRAQQLHVEALLWLAHPAHSLPLRRLLGLASRAHYRLALSHHYQRGRSRRRGGRASR
jgi:RNA polymerase sigma factor (sigma-70 family)